MWAPLPYGSAPRLALRLTADATAVLYTAQLLVGAAAAATPAAAARAAVARAALLVAAAVTHGAHLMAIVAAGALTKRVLVDVLVDSGDHPLGTATGSPWWAPIVDGPVGYGALAFLVVAAVGGGGGRDGGGDGGGVTVAGGGAAAAVAAGGWVMRRGCRRGNVAVAFLFALFLADRCARGIVRGEWVSVAVGGGLGVGVVAAAVTESRAATRLRGAPKRA